MEKYRFKKDKFSSARGNTSRFISIFCGKCGHEIMLYQKDGAGNLFRFYLDKIKAPEGFMQASSKKEMQALKCSKCGEVLAMPMIYEKENRLALRIVGPIRKVNNPSGTFPIMKNN